MSEECVSHFRSIILPINDFQRLLKRSDRVLVFQEENNVPKDCGCCRGDSGGEGEDQLRLQQRDQEGNYHVNA